MCQNSIFIKTLHFLVKIETCENSSCMQSNGYVYLKTLIFSILDNGHTRGQTHKVSISNVS